MKNFIKTKVIILSLILGTISCSKDDDSIQPVNEEEVITTVSVTLINGSQTITLKSVDLDGDGPNAPTFTSTGGNLSSNTTYIGNIEFINDLKNPAENITSEVEEEGTEHQVFYQIPSTIGNITYNPTDIDSNGKPIGLKFSLTTSNSAATGNLIVTLRHQPNKNAAGVATGDITNAGGATDAQVTLPVEIQ